MKIKEDKWRLIKQQVIFYDYIYYIPQNSI